MKEDYIFVAYFVIDYKYVIPLGLVHLTAKCEICLTS